MIARRMLVGGANRASPAAAVKSADLSKASRMWDAVQPLPASRSSSQPVSKPANQRAVHQASPGLLVSIPPGFGILFLILPCPLEGNLILDIVFYNCIMFIFRYQALR